MSIWYYKTHSINQMCNTWYCMGYSSIQLAYELNIFQSTGVNWREPEYLQSSRRETNFFLFMGVKRSQCVNNNILLILTVMPHCLCTYTRWWFFSRDRARGRVAIATAVRRHIKIIFTTWLMLRAGTLCHVYGGMVRGVGSRFSDSIFKVKPWTYP